MKAGKLSPEKLETLVLSRLGHRRSDVLIHAGFGEDSAVIDFGDEVCIISTDPITGAVEGLGELAVNVSCNDVAANGGHPIGVQVVLLLPEGTEDAALGQIIQDIDRAAAALNVEVIGGHTEVTSKVSQIVVSVTAIGRAPKDRYVASSGARPGDGIVMTKTAGIEGTLVLAQDFSDRLPAIPQVDVNRLRRQLSVVREGILAAAFGVSAMHDMTEGGLLGAALELAAASEVGFVINEDAVPIAPLTHQICRQFGLDPLALLSSGSMLITSSRASELVRFLNDHKIEAARIGTIHAGRKALLQRNNELIELPACIEDELWRFFSRQ